MSLPELAPYNCVGCPESALESSDRPWQIYRRDNQRYTVRLNGGEATPLVTIRDGIVTAIDPVIPWPEPNIIAHEADAERGFR
jgi:hypothetical protein